MKTILVNTLCYLLCIAGYASNTPSLVFKENKNQWDKQALYAADFQNGAVFLCGNNFTFIAADTSDMKRIRLAHHAMDDKKPLDLTVHLHIFKQVFENANSACMVTGGDKLNEYFNYYLGKDPARWAGHVGGFSSVTYQNLYNGINLDVTSEGVNMKYSFVVKNGADPSLIKFAYPGIEALKINDGALVLTTSVGDIIDSRPYAYQMIGSKAKAVNCEYRILNGHVQFVFPDGYDRSSELVIDPTLVFSTYSGSTADNFGYSGTYDKHGNVYASGTVFQYTNTSYPLTTGAFQTSWAGGTGFGQATYDGSGTDIGITKYDSLGQTRIYSTYLGGNSDEQPHSMVVNGNDELFVFGTTGSNNFPVTVNAIGPIFKGGTDPGIFNGIGVHYTTGSDMFVTHFSADGSALVGSTYLGGTGNDGLNYPEYAGLNYNYGDDARGDINIDHAGNVYIAATTFSTDFPVTSGAYQTVKDSGSDGIIVKMNDSLTRITWATFLGGNGNDAIYSLDFDQNDDIYVAGGTTSNTFPVTATAYQRNTGGGRADGFIAHLSKNGNALMHSTYFGSNQYDQIYFVRVDGNNHPYVFGQTGATDSTFIIDAGYSRGNSGQFISKFTYALDSVMWSTAFGSGRGQPDICPTAFMVDKCNKTYISGWGANFVALYNITGAPALSTAGLDVTPDALQLTTDSSDFYMMVLNPDASSLNYASYFGSPNDEQHIDGGSSKFDSQGVIYQSVCAGCNGRSTFPTTPGAVSRTNNSANCNNAVFKLDFHISGAPLVAAFNAPSTGCAGDTILFTNQSTGAVNTAYTWFFGDGDTTTIINPTHSYAQPGTYTVKLVATNTNNCNSTDAAYEQVVISDSAFCVVQPLGINNILNKPLVLFPNPGTCQFFIRFAYPINDCAITVTNCLGEIILQKSALNAQAGANLALDMTKASPGIYFVTIEVARQLKTTLKWVKEF